MWPVAFHLLTGTLCLLGSTSFHLFGCKNPKVYMYLRRLDMSGVGANLVGAFLPVAYYIFYCHEWLSYVYICLQMSTFLMTQALSMQSWFYLSENTKLRGNVYIISGTAMAFPVAHGILVSFWANKHNNYIPFYEIMHHQVLSVACVLIGVQFYKYKVPERFKPGLFDIWVTVC